MATVTFPNGKSVNFQGTPTPKDVEYVASQLGITPTASTNSGPSLSTATDTTTQAIPDSTTGNFTPMSVARFLQNNIETPIVSIAGAPVQAGVMAANAITGGNVPDPYAKGIPSLTGRNIPITPATPGGFLQKVGQAGQLATFAAAPEISGLTQWAGLGAASGLSNSLAQGNATADPGQVLRDTIYGGLWGIAFGEGSNLLNRFGGGVEATAGIDDKMKNEINGVDPSLVSSYADTAQNHSSDIRTSTPYGLSETEARYRANLLVTQAIPAAGRAVGEAKNAAANLPVVFSGPTGPVSGAEAVNSISDDINGIMQSMTGHQFDSYGTGESGGITINNYPEGASTQGINATDGAVSQIPGRAVKLSSTETSQLERLHAYLQTLQANPTVRTASDMLTNLDNDIGKWSTPVYGESGGNSPVQGVLRYARGAINRIISPASPALAAANAAYSSLKDLQATIGHEAGNMAQNMSLMMRRVTSGDQASDVIPALDSLDAAVQPYLGDGHQGSLVQHSLLADWATKQFGDSSTQTKMEGMLGGVKNLTDLFGWGRQVVADRIRGVFSLFTPDAEKYAISVANGKPLSMNPLVRLVDSSIESAKAQPIIGAMAKQLEDWGVVQKSEDMARAFFKTWLIKKFITPAQTTQQSGPSIITPQDVPNQQSLAPTAPSAPQRTLAVQGPIQKTINQSTPPMSGQAFSQQQRSLTAESGLSLGGTSSSMRLS